MSSSAEVYPIAHDTARWRAEDFRIEQRKLPARDDHWQPVQPKARISIVAKCDEATAAAHAEAASALPSSRIDWFDEDEGIGARFHTLATPVAAADQDDFNEFSALPRFDPAARRPSWTDDVYDRPLARGTYFKARFIASRSSLATSWERDRLARLCENLFDERPEHPVFRVWTQLAAEIEDVSVAALTIELKLLWDDTPEFWYFRTGSVFAPRYSEAARNQFSWQSALRIASAVPYESAANLLNGDRLEDWRDLDGVGPGFWSFAQFAEIAASADEAEATLSSELRRQRKARLWTRAVTEDGAHRQGGFKVCRVHYGTVGGDRIQQLSSAYETWLAKRAKADGAEVSSLPGPPTRKRN